MSRIGTRTASWRSTRFSAARAPAPRPLRLAGVKAWSKSQIGSTCSRISPAYEQSRCGSARCGHTCAPARRPISLRAISCATAPVIWWSTSRRCRAARPLACSRSFMGASRRCTPCGFMASISPGSTARQRRPRMPARPRLAPAFVCMGSTRAAQRGQTLHFTLVWDASAPPPKDYWLFAHLIGPDNQRYAQLDVPYPTSQWAPGRFASTDLPIALPPNAPTGGYRLLIGLYDQSTGQRLALTTTVAGAVAAGEPDAFVLTQFDLK